MSNRKFTEGPWKLTRDILAKSPQLLVSARDRDGERSTLAAVYQFDDDLGANAALIKAAPNLITALRDALAAHEYDGPLQIGATYLHPAIEEQIRAAIALATTIEDL